jgi:hypothetical protein
LPRELLLRSSLKKSKGFEFKLEFINQAAAKTKYSLLLFYEIHQAFLLKQAWKQKGTSSMQV